MALTRKQKELKLELLKEKKRRDFHYFLKNTFPRFIDGQFYHDLCDKLQKFSQDVKDKKSPRLLLSVPPRHGKSETTTVRFALWLMLNNPDFEIIAASNSQDLAEGFSRKAKTLLESDFINNLWSHVNPSEKLFTNKEWMLSNGSKYFAGSVGGQSTGKGGHIFIVDDPIRDLKQANSDAFISELEDWFNAVAQTRVYPGGGIIIIATRWSERDLTAKILKQMARKEIDDEYQTVFYPAIAENDIDWRKKGEALHEEWFSRDRLLKIKKAVGSKAWESLYQQNPTSATDKIICTDWIEQIDKLPIANWSKQEVIVAVDSAFTGKTTSDYNVAVCLAKGLDGRLYLLDYLRIQADFVSFLKEFTSWYSKLPTVNILLLENKANGEALKSVLKQRFNNIRMVNPDSDKITRVSAIAPMVEDGALVFLRKRTPEYLDILEEINKFPNYSTDDFVDALTYALQYFLTKSQKSFDKVDWSNIFNRI